MKFISLLTDFSIKDTYVGEMKGKIYSCLPEVTIIDLTHQISPQNISEASRALKRSYFHCPKRTVHVVVVDPGVGSERDILFLSHKEHYFIAPDNGVLTFLLEDAFTKIWVVKNEFISQLNPSVTFHGRDIMGPLAAMFLSGTEIDAFATLKTGESCQKIKFSKPIVKNKCVGVVIEGFDSFGNILTNFQPTSEEITCIKEVTYRNQLIPFCVAGYSSVSQGEALSLLDSSGSLEIAVNCGSAKEYFQAKISEKISIVFS